MKEKYAALLLEKCLDLKNSTYLYISYPKEVEEFAYFMKEFAEKTAAYVRNALPAELAGAQVRTASPDLWADGPHEVLLVIRPWINAAAGFRLDGWHAKYRDGSVSVEDAAAAIINDRRLYVMPSAAISRDASGMDGCAFIYA